VPRDVAMPLLPRSSLALRLAELAVFGSFGLVEWALFWVFLVAMVLGIARLVIVLALAAIQRVRSHRHSMRLDAAAAAGHPSVGHGYAPPVSIIVPAYKEEKVIIKTITSLLSQEYRGTIEIVVVDDGSPDDTYDIAMEAYGSNPQVSVYTKPNGGKASALNYGIERARGDIVIGLDADTVFTTRTVAELVAPLADPRVGAVAGNAKVGNRINIVTQWQAVEYVTSQNTDRRAFSLLDCITVVPGAVGAWRKALVLEAGGFSDDTLAEDQDLTLEIRRRGHSIAYADEAIAYTEAPDTLRGLAKQRFRWSFGTLQCMWKHRDALFRPRYGTLGFIAMPNVWIFQLLFAALSPIADLMFVWSLLSIGLARMQHGDTFALLNLEKVLTFYAVFLFVDWLAAMVAFLMEPREDKRLTWLIVIQRFAYRQVMYWVVLRSFAAALRGRVVGWGSLERKATVQVPVRARPA
jgi:cellulose synthase/poly-beta-1,6-N-acetylglucosamine synthase-like glycosyltransferase